MRGGTCFPSGIVIHGRAHSGADCLNHRSADHLPEVGCGTGVAAVCICERLR
jgi:hypothetical protein